MESLGEYYEGLYFMLCYLIVKQIILIKISASKNQQASVKKSK